MEFVRVIEVKFTSNAKAVEPIEVTDEGRTTSLIPILFTKARSPMEVALESMTTFPLQVEVFVTTPFTIEYVPSIEHGKVISAIAGVGNKPVIPASARRVEIIPTD
jgi:hypothetical protein